MRNTTKKLRWLALLVLIFYACQSEYDTLTLRSKNSTTTATLLTGSDALKMKRELLSELNNNNQIGISRITSALGKRNINNSSQRTSLSDIERYIDSTRVVLLIDTIARKKNYSFMLAIPDTSKTTFYNLVMRDYNGYRRTSMITYDMDPDYAKEYAVTDDLTNFTGQITLEIVAEDEDDPCNHISHGGGGIYMANPYEGVYENYNPHPSWEMVQAQLAERGFALDNAPPEWIEVSRSPRYFRLSYNLSDDAECDEDEVGVIPPDPHVKNCEELKKMMEDHTIRNTFTTLKNKVSAAPANRREWGYAFSNDNPPEELELGDYSNNTLELPSGGSIYGGNHTHPYDSNPDEGYIPMFSISDIYQLAVIKNRYQGTTIPVSKFVFTLTVKSGNSTETFAIKISNSTQFYQWAFSFNQMSRSDRETLAKNLADIYTETRDAGGGWSSYAKDLLGFMSDKNIAGLDLYKADDENFSGWSKIRLNHNNEVTEIPCK
ncbi:hypothetical protein [Flavobacterium rhizosphaerae]|uniref:Uncharacterized protein n=1 Tax=Flavobacterium rhizosphaerae TaxID=3163298 RepID=A0ABW8YV96_9FLAO